MLKVAILLQNATEIRNFSTALKIGFFLKKMVVFFGTNYWTFSEPLKFQRRNLPKQATELVKNLETFKFWIFMRETCVLLYKFLLFSDIPRNSKFAAECNWDQKVSQNCECLWVWLSKLGFSKQIKKKHFKTARR